MILSVTLPGSTEPINTTTTIPSGVITVTGPNVTSSHLVPGAQQDPADLYGIVLVCVGMAVALFGTRWLFGHKRPHPQASRFRDPSLDEDRDRDEHPAEPDGHPAEPDGHPAEP